MDMSRRILFIITALILGTAMTAGASVTKVGNGNDGADLENLKMLKEGPIVETRAIAVARIKALNVAGIPGLGLLIPELERTDLMMAQEDAHPTGEAEGTMEIAPDRGVVYARTFAEPYAVTRFFPAAKKLSTEQLIALHVHEALHRSLPPNIRENEDIVMHLTMALTSPGSSFDRVRQVARLYVKTDAAPTAATDFDGRREISITSQMPLQRRELPRRSRSKIGYQYESFSSDYSTPEGISNWHGLEFLGSLGGYHHVGSLAIEPVFRARAKSTTGYTENLLHFGPSAFDLMGRIAAEDGSVTAPYVRFSAKSFDSFDPYEERFRRWRDRDIWTIGLSHQRRSRLGYLESDLFYSLPSESRSRYLNIKYQSILSLRTHAGWQLRKLRVGGVGEVHASQGMTAVVKTDSRYGDGYVMPGVEYKGKTEPFRLLVAGPEIGFAGDRIQATAYAKVIMNSTLTNLTHLGDVMDRGKGYSSYGVSMSAQF